MAAPVVAPTGPQVTWINAVVASPNARPLPDPPCGAWAQLKKTNLGTFSTPVANAPDYLRAIRGADVEWNLGEPGRWAAARGDVDVMAEQQSLYDKWQHPDGTVVWLASTNREAYARAGLSLLAEEDFDYTQQQAADAAAGAWRGMTNDRIRMPEGPTAYFPATG